MKITNYLKKKGLTPMTMLLIACLVVGGVVAALVASRTITTSITIVAHMDLEVYDINGTTILVSIDFGELYRGTTTMFPASPDTYFIKNIGEDTIYVGWDFDGTIMPVTIAVYMDGVILTRDSGRKALSAGASCTITIKITVSSTADFATFTPDLYFCGYDTA